MSDVPAVHEEAQESPESDGSVLGDIRALRERKASEKASTLILDVPGYGSPSALSVVYKYPAGGYKAALKGARIEQQGKKPDAELEGSADVLIACCACVIGKRADGTFVNLLNDAPITPEDTLDMAEPLRFNKTLAEKLKIDVPPEVEFPGRFVVRHVFSPAAAMTGRYEGDLAVIGASNVVFAWLQGAVRETDKEISGE